jgi:serine/threonine protein kinase
MSVDRPDDAAECAAPPAARGYAPAMDPADGTYRTGDLLVGKYRIEGILGRGGMAIVYAAQHELLAQPVALKVIQPSAGDASVVVPRFLSEARAVARLRSAHVVRVMDVGTLDDGAPFLVMERLVGQDLAHLLETRGRLPVVLVVDYILQALEAIAEAHVNGIVHRDLKPANLFVAEDGPVTTIKVLDFGIFKATDAFQSGGGGHQGDETATGAVLGTPAYMSPEQLRSSKKVDARADVWSVGVILYELLASTLPFDGDSIGALFKAILEHEPKSLQELRPDVPDGLALAVVGCLQKDRTLRFASVGVVASALLPFASPEGARSAARVIEVAARIPRLSFEESDTVVGATLRSIGNAPSKPVVVTPAVVQLRPADSPRTGWLVPVIAALVLAAVGGLVVRAWPSAVMSQPAGPLDVSSSAPPIVALPPPIPLPADPLPLATAAPAPLAKPAPNTRAAGHAPTRGAPPPLKPPPGLATDRQW